jgi:hypothetical protein
VSLGVDLVAFPEEVSVMVLFFIQSYRLVYFLQRPVHTPRKAAARQPCLAYLPKFWEGNTESLSQEKKPDDDEEQQ